MPILLHGKPVTARMISDGSNHGGIADYFTGSDKHQIRDMLLAFIHARVQNDAVVANLMKFIYNNQETLTLDGGDPSISPMPNSSSALTRCCSSATAACGCLAGIRKPAMNKLTVP